MYKGKAGQRSDSSALLPRKIGVLLDLDLNVGTYVGRQPSRVAFFSDPELIRSSTHLKNGQNEEVILFFLSPFPI